MSTVSNTTQPHGKLLTYVVYILGVVLFAFCLIYLFGNSCGNNMPVGKKTNVDSSFTTIKKDTVKSEAGKSIIVSSNSTSTIKQNDELSGDSLNKKLDTVFKYFILLFGVFIILLVLPRLKNFDISKDGIKAELFEVAKAINETQSQTTQQTDNTHPEVKNKLRISGLEKITAAVQTENEDDPQKGKWSGSAENNGRVLSASIKRITGSDWADIVLKVESTDKTKPLTGVVYFHLHPTFSNPNPVIIVLEGKAELRFKAWGAFTVGAECDNKATKLELCLSEHPEAFSPFKER
jgi:hypothetical protein